MSNSNSELVSVVVPIYGVEATLAACLDSVLAQTHARLEVVCVVDGSPDGSAAIAREYAGRDARVRVIEKGNEGYGASVNRGLREARGDWVAIVEPDDTVEPTMLEVLLACAREQGGIGNVDVVRAPYWRVLANGGGESVVMCPYKGRVRPRRQPFAVGDGIELMLHHPAIWAGIYRAGYLDERKIRLVEAPGAGWADNPFMVDTLCQTTRIAYVDVPVYRYAEHDFNDASALAARQPLVPLTRWNEMMDSLGRSGCQDGRVRAALVLRGINYATITVEAAGLGAPGVSELVERSFARLDPAEVFGDARVPDAGRTLFSQVRGIEQPPRKRLARLGYLLREGLWRLRAGGPAFALRLLRERRGRL